MDTTLCLISCFKIIFIINKAKMRNKVKSYFFRSFVFGVLLVASISCTTTNPPVNGTTGATTAYPKK